MKKLMIFVECQDCGRFVFKSPKPESEWSEWWLPIHLPKLKEQFDMRKGGNKSCPICEAQDYRRPISVPSPSVPVVSESVVVQARLVE